MFGFTFFFFRCKYQHQQKVAGKKVVKNILQNRVKEEKRMEEYYYFIYEQFLESRYIVRLRGWGRRLRGKGGEFSENKHFIITYQQEKKKSALLF